MLAGLGLARAGETGTSYTGAIGPDSSPSPTLLRPTCSGEEAPRERPHDSLWSRRSSRLLWVLLSQGRWARRATSAPRRSRPLAAKRTHGHDQPDPQH